MGPPSYVQACNFKALKGDLKYWNKNDFGDVHFRKTCLFSELLDLDIREGVQVLSMVDKTRKTEIKENIQFLASLEEIS